MKYAHHDMVGLYASRTSSVSPGILKVPFNMRLNIEPHSIQSSQFSHVPLAITWTPKFDQNLRCLARDSVLGGSSHLVKWNPKL